jgi:hypothetical protein
VNKKTQKSTSFEVNEFEKPIICKKNAERLLGSARLVSGLSPQ